MEVKPQPRTVNIEDPSGAGEARRAASEMAASVGLGDEDAGRAALVTFEVATNVLKHARGGEILLRPLRRGVEILGVDRGPGMTDVAACLRDGFTTAGSPGTGLGAISRVASAFDVHSIPGAGTVLMARVCAAPDRRRAPRGFDVGGLAVAKRGETRCGDAWSACEDADGLSVFVVDGLGHGDAAADVAALAVATFERTPSSGVCDILDAVHAALRPTRGAAVAVSRIDVRHGVVRFAGIGNIAAVVVAPDGTRRQAVSHNGIAGHGAPRIAEFTYPYPEGATLIMHSDGLQSHWTLPAVASVLPRDPTVVAGLLYRDWTRGRDDVSVVVARKAAA